MGVDTLLSPYHALSRNMGWLPDHVWQKKGGGKGWGGGRDPMVTVPLSVLMGSSKGYGKGYGKGKKPGKKLVVNPKHKLWIGDLPEIEDRSQRKEASIKLQELFKKKGADCKFAEISHKGTGVAQFQNEEAAITAMAALSGSKFMGKALEIDSWEKA